MAGKKIKLIRPILHVDGKTELKEVTVKSEDEMSASDFYDVQFSADGTVKLGDMSSAVANLCGLTSAQVRSMHPTDYFSLSGEVGKYIL